MAAVNFKLDQGCCTSRDKTALSPGEMVQCTGGYYKPGDPGGLWKIGGRASFGSTGSSAKILGMKLCQFDSGSDQLVALSGTTLYGATPGVTGTWASLTTGLSTATELYGCHAMNRWYLSNGVDYPRVLESDKSVRRMGMLAPDVPTAVASTGGTSNRPSAVVNNATFTNPQLAYDTSVSTYSQGALSVTGTQTCTWTTFAGDASAGRKLFVLYALGSIPVDSNVDRQDFGVGGTTDAGYNVTLKLEKSEDSGSNWTTIYTETRTKSITNSTSAQAPITANSNLVQMRATLTYNSGTSLARFVIYDIKIAAGGTGGNVTTTSGMFYAITEYDTARGLESEPSDATPIVSLAAQNTVTLTLPTSFRNTNSTMFRVYRTTDGGSQPSGLGFIGHANLADLTFIDDCGTGGQYPTTIQTFPLLAMSSITVDGGTVSFPRDTPPPTLRSMDFYKGSVVAVTGNRALRWSEAGYPESWPEGNTILSFPMPQHASLVAVRTVGETLLIAADGTMMTLTDIPRVVDGVFNNSEVIPLGGQPGCVGHKAIISFSVQGESRAAWVSPFGVHVTNGQTAWKISDDIDWFNTVYAANLGTSVLHFWQDTAIMVFAFDSSGVGYNDRYIFFHMHPNHVKVVGTILHSVQYPKWTGLHYGNIACMASGTLSTGFQTWSGHTSNGIVYTENYGLTDASSAYSGTIVPLIVQAATLIDNDKNLYIQVTRGSLWHSDWGTGQTLTLGWTSNGDKGSSQDVTTQSISLSGLVDDDFWVAEGGEYHDYTFTHLGAATGRIARYNLFLREGAEVGPVLTT